MAKVPRGTFADRSPYDDETGRPRCVADLTSAPGVRCSKPPIRGGRVCYKHGGNLPNVRRGAMQQLQELAPSAVDTLANEMFTADSSADRQRAANSILKFAGFEQTNVKVDVDDARAALIAGLEKMKAEPHAE